MRNTLSIIGISWLMILSPLEPHKAAFANDLMEIIEFWAKFCREAWCGSKVKKATEEKLPEWCRKVYMDMPWDNSFVYSTLVCECREKEEDILLSLQEK